MGAVETRELSRDLLMNVAIATVLDATVATVFACLEATMNLGGDEACRQAGNARLKLPDCHY